MLPASAPPPGSQSEAISSPPESPTWSGGARIDTKYTTPLLDVRTDGDEIVWSRGGGDPNPSSAPDLWHYRPGDERPTELYHNPIRDSTLAFIAVRGGRYAFVETNPRVYGENAYVVWVLIDGAATVVDKIESKPGEMQLPLPFLALTPERLLWSTAHARPGGLRYELLSYDMRAGASAVLQSVDGATEAIWFPAVDADGRRIVYSTVTLSSSGDAFHVLVADLEPGSSPRQLDVDGRATMPVISGDAVYWKRVRGNVLNASSLVKYSLDARGTPEPVAVLGEGLNYPSIGDRYLTAWQDADHDVGLLDLRTGERIAVDPVAPGAEEGRERAGIGGDLLYYLRADLSSSGRPLELWWQRLPPAEE